MEGLMGDRRGLNSRPSDSQSDALPAELLSPRGGLVWAAGFEPTASAFQVQRSTKLSYAQTRAGPLRGCYGRAGRCRSVNIPALYRIRPRRSMVRTPAFEVGNGSSNLPVGSTSPCAEAR